MSAVSCPVCGHVATLPTISPEGLWFLSYSNPEPKRGAVMPDGSLAIAFAGVIYSMSEEEWSQYESMSESAEVFQPN